MLRSLQLAAHPEQDMPGIAPIAARHASASPAAIGEAAALHCAHNPSHRSNHLTIAERLHELGIQLPAVRPPAANYVGAVTTGNLVFISGHGPYRADGSLVAGKVDAERTIEEGYEAARLTMLNCLATLQAEVGSLDRVSRIVKLFGMVNCTETFGRQPEVINGASDLLIAIFGERGRHARSAVGMQMLPFNITTEIEMIVEIA
jgi:enamine deaminase RidA (YjgF/YER057c/UK114 family)